MTPEGLAWWAVALAAFLGSLAGAVAGSLIVAVITALRRPGK